MDALILAAGTEALKAWGPLGILLIATGLGWWRSATGSKAKEARIAELEAEKRTDLETRVSELRQMIEVTRTGTETMATRSQGDEQFREILTSSFRAIQASLEEIKAAQVSSRPRPRGRSRR